MRRWIGAAVIVALAVGYEFYALGHPGMWVWSEIMSQISDSKFGLTLVSWFIGFVMGHALAPHYSKFKGAKK